MATGLETGYGAGLEAAGLGAEVVGQGMGLMVSELSESVAWGMHDGSSRSASRVWGTESICCGFQG